MVSVEYQSLFEQMLADAASGCSDTTAALSPFWPIKGAGYRSDLLVIGRAVNGWVKKWSVGELQDPHVRHAAAEWLKHDAENTEICRMRWVTDMWRAKEGYRTGRSAFWRVVRAIVLAAPVAAADPETWSSRIAWTNLYKLAPAKGWNPGAGLQRAQRPTAIVLINIEVAEFAPRRILALTGNWIHPFANGIHLKLEGRSGLVEGIGELAGRPCVVAKHPMKKPERQLVHEVLAAFAELGVPLDK